MLQYSEPRLPQYSEPGLTAVKYSASWSSRLNPPKRPSSESKTIWQGKKERTHQHPSQHICIPIWADLSTFWEQISFSELDEDRYSIEVHNLVKVKRNYRSVKLLLGYKDHIISSNRFIHDGKKIVRTPTATEGWTTKIQIQAKELHTLYFPGLKQPTR